MTITLQVPRELIDSSGIDELVLKRHLEEMAVRFLLAQISKNKIERFVKEYKDVLPATDEEVEALIESLKNEDD